MTLRLLAIHAHPDDESSKGAGTYASYVDAGAEVMIVSCTGGEAGDVLNSAVHARAHAERDIAGLRRLEMAAAQSILGVQHRWLGYADSGLPDDGVVADNSFARIPLDVSVRPLIRLIRSFRPHVLVTYDETGGYPHPDHIRTHEVSMLAWQLAGNTNYPELGEPWTPQKLYYDRTMSQRRAKSLLDHIAQSPERHLAERMEAALGFMLEIQGTPTTQISIANYIDRRDAALRAHESQVAADHEFFFAYPRDLEREAYPYDDYELVASRVPCELPEDDLFTGVIEEGLQ